MYTSGIQVNTGSKCSTFSLAQRRDKNMYRPANPTYALLLQARGQLVFPPLYWFRFSPVWDMHYSAIWVRERGRELFLLEVWHTHQKGTSVAMLAAYPSFLLCHIRFQDVGSCSSIYHNHDPHTHIYPLLPTLGTSLNILLDNHNHARNTHTYRCKRIVVSRDRRSSSHAWVQAATNLRKQGSYPRPSTKKINLCHKQ
jgi:hypothetical protein